MFHLSDMSEKGDLNIMQNIKISNAGGIDKLSGKLLKDGAKIVAKTISEICNLSLPLELFQIFAKFQSSNPFSKKTNKLTHLTTDLFNCYR